VDQLYRAAVAQTVPAASVKVAESAKLLENIFRCVNIAMVNELKIVFQRMGIDVWEVIRAASTKPFGFMPFYPGPGLGGHCIPIDPFYLTWKAREYGVNTRFIELAGEVNSAMPEYVLGRVRIACDRIGKPLRGTGVLVLGIAYKKNIGDQRESPALEILEQLRAAGADIAYSDPFCSSCAGHRHYPSLSLTSQTLSAALIAAHPIVVLATDHDAFDYEQIHRWVADAGGAIVDSRHAFAAHGVTSDRIIDA
jgi:UDP-N-acetyl-D-glucosamine dehydrogenase